MDARDKERKNAWKARERQNARGAFPVPDESLERLFSHVADAVERNGCDHSMRATEEWIAVEKCDRETLLAWLTENGGHCDCEVSTNAGDAWEQNR